MAEVFLSYSQADNFFPNDWVKKFHESLERITIVTAGRRKFTIWKDTRDRSGTDLEQSIKDALGEATFLLTLVSPLYFEDESGWCKKERDYFINDVVRDVNAAKSRIITAIKYFDEKEDELQMPEELKSQFRYKLYKLTDNNIPRPLTPDDPEWDDCLLTIAHTLKKELKKIESQQSAQNVRQVFLASSKELYDEQLRLTTELESVGFKVKTLFPNLKNPDAWKIEFSNILKTCQASIHMFSEKYETKPDINASLEDQQWKWAIDESRRTNIKVLSWIAKGLSIKDEHQAQFIQSIKENDHLPPGHDFLEKTFEEFISSIKDYIND